MAKPRVYQLARELNRDNSEIIRELQHMGVPVTSHSNTVEDRLADQLRKKLGVSEQVLVTTPDDEAIEHMPVEIVEATAVAPEPALQAPPAAIEVDRPEPARVEVKAEPRVEVEPKTDGHRQLVQESPKPPLPVEPRIEPRIEA